MCRTGKSYFYHVSKPRFYYSPHNCYIIPDGAHRFKTPPENALICTDKNEKLSTQNIDSVAPFYHSFILLTKGIWICAAQSDTYLRKHHWNMPQKIPSQSMHGGKSRQINTADNEKGA